MTTKPNPGPPVICGRPYVLFDPEQTAEIKRVERKNELIERIIQGLDSALVAVDEYVYEYLPDKALRDTVLEAVGFLLHVSGAEYDEEIEEIMVSTGLPEIKWKGEVETLC
ncbi:hypothetical protein M655_025110 [Brevibacillus sp. NSP2.1]|uniref:hypothetical protein n=1 Tax=Brevibacillus sp. NSP2.1 TaxID=3003229 RepID=UPI0004185D7B|nr:hypothetical protein [Brevibacillus sp. NSP2.1]QHZ58650.1 hypothetical protein M655_025110 [Brevibacillus sp. NSP2.1]